MSTSEELRRYREAWTLNTRPDAQAQKLVAERFQNFTTREPRCYSRECPDAHMTSSALIVTPDLKRVLLTHHKKLNLWLQLDGHADGNPVLFETALREGMEESGLEDLQFLSYAECFGDSDVPPLLFDLDIHWIPERKTDPGNYHYDARYLLFTESPEKFTSSEESHAIRWFDLEQAYGTSTEWSMHRQFDKVKYLRGLI